MSQNNFRKLTGLFFIVGAMLVNIPYTLLIMNFDYPDVLRLPTAEILTKFQAGGNALIYTWLAFAWVGLPMLFGAIMLKRVLADEQAPFLETATTLGAVVGVAEKDADQQPAPGRRERPCKLVPVGAREFAARERNHRLRRHDERAARGVDLAQQRLQMRAHQGRIELQVLRDVGLQQAHFELAAGSRETRRQHVRRGDHDRREAGDAQAPAHTDRAQTRRQRRRKKCRKRAQTVDADPRRPGRKRPDGMRVARCDPREAGEEDAAREFGEQPAGGKQQGVGERRT